MTIEDLARAIYKATIDRAWPDYRTAAPTWEAETDSMRLWRCREGARAAVRALEEPIMRAITYGDDALILALIAEAREAAQ